MVSQIVKAFYKVADPIISAVANPIKTVAAAVSPTKTVKQVQDEYFKQSKTAQAIDFAIGATSIGLGTTAVATTAGRAAATQVAKSVGSSAIKAPIKTLAIGASIPIAIGAVKSNPKEVISTVAKAPSELQTFGSDIAKVVSSPSLQSAKQLVSNSPILTTATAVLGAGAIAKTVSPIASGLLQREALQEQTEVLQSAVSNNIPSQLTEAPPKGVAKDTPKAPQTPITPETQPLIATAGSGNGSKKRRKASRKPKVQPISQRVNVIVSNRANATGIRARKTERIINKEVLMN